MYLKDILDGIKNRKEFKFFNGYEWFTISPQELLSYIGENYMEDDEYYTIRIEQSAEEIVSENIRAIVSIVNSELEQSSPVRDKILHHINEVNLGYLQMVNRGNIQNDVK